MPIGHVTIGKNSWAATTRIWIRRKLSHVCSSHFSELPTANLKCFVQRKTNVRRVSVMFFRPSALSSDFCTPSKKPVSRQPIQSHHLFHVLFHVLCLRAENDCAIAEPRPGDLGLGSQSCGPGR